MSHWNNILPLLAMAPSPQPGQEAPPFYMQFFPIVLMVIVMYFIMIRPQQRKAKEHDNLLKTLKPGDKILTTGGIVGTVVSVKEKTVSLRSADTKLEVLKSAVSEISERGTETKEA